MLFFFSGDEIVSVNGVNLHNFSHEEALKKFKVNWKKLESFK